MMGYEREIVRRELDRMHKARIAAQERYAYGSRSAGNTMDKYEVLIRILEKALEDDETEGGVHERAIRL